MFVIVLNGQICVTFHLSFLLCFEGESFIFVWHCEMGQFLLLFTFFLVVLPGRKFYLCSTLCNMGTFVLLFTFHFVVFRRRKLYLCLTLCNMGTFVLLFTLCFCCILKEKVLSLYDIIKQANFCYFSPFVFVVFRRKKFYLCLTLCKMATSAQCASPQYCQCDKIKGKCKKKGQC